MKKTKRLSLNAETIRTLTDDESKRAAGGWSYYCTEYDQTCGPSGCQCTEGLCGPTRHIYC